MSKRLITTSDHLRAFARQEISAEDLMRGIGVKCYSHLIAVLIDHEMIVEPFERRRRPKLDENS